MKPPATRWESPHQRRLLGPPTISDAAVARLRQRLGDLPAIHEAYLVEEEIIEPSRGTSHATDLALWLGDRGPEAEKELEIVEALAEMLERENLEMSVVTRAGLAAVRRRGLRVL